MKEEVARNGRTVPSLHVRVYRFWDGEANGQDGSLTTREGVSMSASDFKDVREFPHCK